MSALEFKAFKVAGSKVKAIEFHPVQPWLAFADESNNVVVWDWRSQQEVYECQLPGTDDLSLQDAMLLRLAEKDSTYFGPTLSQNINLPKVAPSGNVRDIRFLDTEVAYWQIAQQHSMQHNVHSSSTVPNLGKVRGLKGHRWLVLTFETKVHLQDLVSGVSQEVPRPLLDAKAPTRVAFMFAHSPALLGYGSGGKNTESIITPIMAIGTSSGLIFLVSVATLQVYCRLVHHKGAITSLLVMASQKLGGPDMLLSASADGTIALWDPSAQAPRGAEKEVVPKVSFKAHASSVWAMTLFQVAESPEAAPLRLLTTGEDKTVAMWNAELWKEIKRDRPLPKGGFTAAQYSPREGAVAGYGPPLLLCSDEKPAIWGMNGGSTAVRELLSLEGFVPAGAKKVPKVYDMLVHPLLPHVLAVATNTGVGLLSFSPFALPPIHRLKAPAPAADLFSLQAAGAPPSAATYIAALGSNIWAVTHRSVWRDDPASHVGQLGTEVAMKYSIAKMTRPGPVVLGCSASGRCVSAVWPDSKHFAIYCLSGSGEWGKLDEGSGTAVAWASSSTIYAVISEPEVKMPEPARARSKKKAKAKEEEAAMAAAVAAAVAAAADACSVQAYQVEDGSDKVKWLAEVPTGTGRATGLHGGALLGVVQGATLRGGSRRGRAMQLHTWRKMAPVGPALVEPQWLAWDPTVSMLALAYPDGITLCRTRPSFQAFAVLPLTESTCGLWHHRALIACSPTTVQCAFVSLEAVTPAGTAKPPVLEVVRLASIGGEACGHGMGVAGDAAGAAVPPEAMLCGRPAVAIGLYGSSLWLADSRGQPFVVPVGHPGLRARFLAAAGDCAAARTAAEKGLAPEHHDEVGRFIAGMDSAGPPEAAKLPGLSLANELAMSVRSRELARALACLQALAAGASDRAALELTPLWQHRASVTPPLQAIGSAPAWQMSGTFGTGAFPGAPADGALDAGLFTGSPIPTEPPPKRAAQPSNGDAEEHSPSELPTAEVPIDWDAPARGFPDGQPATAPPPTEAWPGSGPSTSASTSTSWQAFPDRGMEQVAAAAADALALADAAWSKGSKDIAAAALRILLQCAPRLEPQAGLQVLLRCARAGLAADLRGFAAGLAQAGGGGRAVPPQLAACAAALLEDPSLVQATLQASGLAAMASLYAQVWRNGNAVQAQQEWAASLWQAGLNSTSVPATIVPPT